MKNNILLQAARGEQTDRVPVWMMRQAGRVLPQYRNIRAKVKNFKEFIASPELTAEATIQPLDEWQVDAAIIFSDILVIPEAMGFPFEMEESVGPIFTKKISSITDIEQLRIADDEYYLSYTFDALKIVKQEIKDRCPLIGFCGAPWTIFAYMIEGRGGKDFSKARKFLLEQPIAAHLLMDKITKSSIYYLKKQISCGADIVQVFDSWAATLSYPLFIKYSLPYLKEIVAAITDVPIILFLRGCPYSISSLKDLENIVLGIDWMLKPAIARREAGSSCCLQGNLDPALLYGEDAFIVQETTKMIQGFGTQNYIANLGHGLYPDIHPDKVRLFVDTVQNYRVDG